MKLDAGRLRRRATLLVFTSDANGNWSWADGETVWCLPETVSEKTIFASTARSAPTLRFTLRKRAVPVFSAVSLAGRHHVVAAVNDDDPAYTVLTTAAVEPVPVTRSVPTWAYNALNNPVQGEPTTMTFPGYLTEKYTGHDQQLPQAVTTSTYVLTVPKAVLSHVGELLTVSGVPYRVVAAHETDPWRNEYEVSREADC